MKDINHYTIAIEINEDASQTVHLEYSENILFHARVEDSKVVKIYELKCKYSDLLEFKEILKSLLIEF